jgi:hypothetical protein
VQWLQNSSKINGDNLNNIGRETILGIKTGNIQNTKLMKLQQTVQIRTLETCIEE